MTTATLNKPTFKIPHIHEPNISTDEFHTRSPFLDQRSLIWHILYIINGLDYYYGGIVEVEYIILTLE